MTETSNFCDFKFKIVNIRERDKGKIIFNAGFKFCLSFPNKKAYVLPGNYNRWDKDLGLNCVPDKTQPKNIC